MKKRTGCIWTAAGIMLALVAGALAFVVMLRGTGAGPVTPRAPEVDVVVAKNAIGVRQLIQPDDVMTRTVPVDIAPESAARSVSEVVGQMALGPLSAGEVVQTTDMVSATIQEGEFALAMEKTEVAMAFPAEDLMSRNRLLKPGDHVDVLFSIEVKTEDQENGRLVTFHALQNLEVAAVVLPREPEAKAKAEVGGTAVRPAAIVFVLDPQDALVLKHLRDLGGIVDILLRAPESTERFSTRPVDMPYLIDRYQLRVPMLP